MTAVDENKMLSFPFDKWTKYTKIVIVRFLQGQPLKRPKRPGKNGISWRTQRGQGIIM